VVKPDIEHPDVSVGSSSPGPTSTGFGGERMNRDLMPGAMDVEPVVEGLMGANRCVGQVIGWGAEIERLVPW